MSAVSLSYSFIYLEPETFSKVWNKSISGNKIRMIYPILMCRGRDGQNVPKLWSMAQAATPQRAFLAIQWFIYLFLHLSTTCLSFFSSSNVLQSIISKDLNCWVFILTADFSNTFGSHSKCSGVGRPSSLYRGLVVPGALQLLLFVS